MTDEEKIEYQKMVAEEAYNFLKTVDPECVLAGGAPRNWHLGKPAKDLDFWLRASDDEVDKIEQHFSFVARRQYRQNANNAKYGSVTLEDIVDISLKGENIQVIVVNSNPEDYINDFDFNLCKIKYDFLLGGVFPFPEFDNDIANKTITHNISKLNPNQQIRSQQRLQKMQALFPDFKLVAA